MECRESRELFTPYLSGKLGNSASMQLEGHLKNCLNCRNELEATRKIWELMGEIQVPEPSPGMQADFNVMLRNFKVEQASRNNWLQVWLERLREQWQLQLRPHFAISLVLITFGFALGYFLNRPEKKNLAAYNEQIDSLSSQVSEMKQVMMLTLLQDPSASQRIRAVSYAEELDDANSKVIDALFTTLNGDPNVNVRLVTLEALIKYGDIAKVREGLVHSLSIQESPLLQSAIADAMVKLHEKRSVKTMQKLLNEKDLNEMVKVKFQESINKLI